MRFTYKLKTGGYWELCLGFSGKSWKCIYFFSLTKWMPDIDPEYSEWDEYPEKIYFWFKHPKYWNFSLK